MRHLKIVYRLLSTTNSSVRNSNLKLLSANQVKSKTKKVPEKQITVPNPKKKVFKFKCPHCPFTDESRTSVKKHVLLVHNKKDPFSCPHCSEGFTNLEKMRKHVKLLHPDKPILKEPYEIVEDSVDPFIGNVKPFQIVLLHEDQNKTKLDYLYPMKCDSLSWHNNRTFSCPHCSEDFTNHEKMRKHIKLLHPDKLVLKEPYEIVENDVVDPIDLGDVIWHNNRTFSCPHCSEDFTNHEKMRKHIKLLHPDKLVLKEPYEIVENDVVDPIDLGDVIVKPFKIVLLPEDQNKTKLDYLYPMKCDSLSWHQNKTFLYKRLEIELLSEKVGSKSYSLFPLKNDSLSNFSVEEKAAGKQSDFDQEKLPQNLSEVLPFIRSHLQYFVNKTNKLFK